MIDTILALWNRGGGGRSLLALAALLLLALGLLLCTVLAGNLHSGASALEREGMAAQGRDSGPQSGRAVCAPSPAVKGSAGGDATITEATAEPGPDRGATPAATPPRQPSPLPQLPSPIIPTPISSPVPSPITPTPTPSPVSSPTATPGLPSPTVLPTVAPVPEATPTTVAGSPTPVSGASPTPTAGSPVATTPTPEAGETATVTPSPPGSAPATVISHPVFPLLSARSDMPTAICRGRASRPAAAAPEARTGTDLQLYGAQGLLLLAAILIIVQKRMAGRGRWRVGPPQRRCRQ